MTRIRRTLALLLTLCMVLTMFSGLSIAANAAETSGSCGENAYWSFDEATGTLTISGTGETYHYGQNNGTDENVDSPLWQLASYVREIVIEEGITAINDTLFFDYGYNIDQVTKFTIPATLITLSDYDFFPARVFSRMLGLEEIHVSKDNPKYCDIDGVLYSKDGTELLGYPRGRKGAYVIPDGVEGIANCAIGGPNLTGITFPESLTGIGRENFCGCTFSTLTFPSHLAGIDGYCFLHCRNLVSVTIPASCTYLGSILFDGSGLSHVHVLSMEVDSGFETLRDSLIVALEGGPQWGNEFGPFPMKRFEPTDNPDVVLCPVCHGKVNLKTAEVTDLPSFVDVKSGVYYENPVRWAVEMGITNGTSPTTFSPDRECTRAQIVTFLWRAAGCPTPTSTSHPFIDVEEGSFYEQAVLWAVENGITTGTSPTAFSPYGPCTRAQVVTFLWRANGKPEPENAECPFTDVEEGSFYEQAVLWAVEQGITNGTSPTAFSSYRPCTRAQVVTFLFRVPMQ